MIHDITLTELFALLTEENHTLVDVRSPKEYNESTIPGSVNIPVFNDEERAEVGTIYKQVGPEAARDRGLEIFSKKLPAFIAAFKKINTPLTVFCWRGGMRSKTAATVLDLMGIRANRLTGGIRSYRQWVVHELEGMTFKPELYVLNGYTGTGKTAMLRKLKANGYPIIDLEKMAGHRGSIFGQIGLEPNNQKKFDSLLLTEIQHLQNEPFVFIEGESKRIGKVLLPDFLYDKKQAGLQIFIELPLDVRVQNILHDYKPWDKPEKFLEAYRLIQKRIHIPIAKAIETALQNADYEMAIQLLLQYYYDPRYDHSAKHNDAIIIRANSMDEAYEKLIERI